MLISWRSHQEANDAAKQPSIKITPLDIFKETCGHFQRDQTGYSSQEVGPSPSMIVLIKRDFLCWTMMVSKHQPSGFCVRLLGAGVIITLA